MEEMEDQSQPLAICFGLMLGLAAGAVLMEAPMVWKEASASVCKLGAIEAAQAPDLECPAANPPNMVAILPDGSLLTAGTD